MHLRFSVNELGRFVTVLAYLMLTCLAYVHGDADCSIDRTGLPSDTCAFDLKMKGAQPRSVRYGVPEYLFPRKTNLQQKTLKNLEG